MSAEISAAVCTACQGSIPLQLHGPLTCPYCGAVDAIDGGLRQMVLRVRERLTKRERAWRQFADQQRVFDITFFDRISKHFPLLCVLWFFAGGMFLGTAGTILKPDESLFPLLTGAAPITTDDQALAWATVFTAALFAVITFGIPAAGLFFVRRVAIATRPVAPALPGAPPRCRCCLAELPAVGATRRCAYCGADHLVLDDKWQRHQASLDEQVRDALAQGSASLRDRLKKVEQLVSIALASVIFCLPLSICVVGIISAAMTPAPSHFLVPLVLGAAAVGVYVHQYRKVRAMEDMRVA